MKITSEKRRMKRKRLRILALWMCFCILITAYPNMPEAFVVLAAEEQGKNVVHSVSGFSTLPEEVREQTVLPGTGLEELLLPDRLEATIIRQESENPPEEESVGEETDDEQNYGNDTDTSEDAEGQEGVDVPEGQEGTDTPEDAKGQENTDIQEETDGQEAVEDGEETSGIVQDTHKVVLEEYYAENVILAETLEASSEMEQEMNTVIEGVTWQSEPEYDGNLEGVYLFTAILPEGYMPAEGVSLPQITVTVSDGEQTIMPQVCGWFFDKEAVVPKGDLFYEAGSYRLVLAGGNSEAQILPEMITALFPRSVTVEYIWPAARADEAVDQEKASLGQETLSIFGWNCPEYTENEEGKLPCSGSFFFEAQLEGAGEETQHALLEGVEPVGVWVVFDEPMTLADGIAVPGTITSDQEWSGQTLSAGTYIINPGVTVTVSGRLTVDGNVTIKGGGKLLRSGSYSGDSSNNGSYSALLYVSGGMLTMENITVDGNQIDAYGPALYIGSGTVNLNNKAVIQNNYNMSAGTTGVYSGGGVYCSGILNINGGGIQDCKTSGSIGSSVYSHAGGGIYLKGACKMTSGNITGNSAFNGGGIYLASGATLELEGGAISGNKANGEGNGVYYSTVNNSNGKLKIGGDADAADIIYLDITSGTLYPYITSELHHKITLKCSTTENGKILAEGDGYTLTGVDASKISMDHTGLYSRLDKTKNQILLSDTEEAEATWQESSGGAWKVGKFTTALDKVYDGGTIKLLKDIVIMEKAEITKGVTITSDDPSNPCTMTRMPSGEWGNITISGNSNLTLTNVIYDGNRDYLSGAENAKKQSLIKVGDGAGDTGASLNLGNGAVIRNGYKSSGSGLIAVYGTMTMNSGAVIENCEAAGTGGGIWVSGSGNFTMNGGTIRGCKAGGGGSAISVDGTCVLGGGSITGNTDASDRECAVYLRGSGNGDLTLKGMMISGNTNNIYNEGKRVLIAGSSTLFGNIYTTNAIEATGSGVSGLTETYLVFFKDVSEGAAVVTGSTDTLHYRLDHTVYTLSPDGANLIATKGYPVTITTFKDNVSWTAPMAYKLISDNGGGVFTDLTAVWPGTYQIYAGDMDTGRTVTVGNAEAVARIDYDTVTFYSGSMTLADPAPQIILRGKNAVKPLSQPSRTGYTFDKWVTSNGGSVAYDFPNTIINGKTGIYASWMANRYQISFDYQGATGGNSLKGTEVEYGGRYGTLPKPEKSGYTFKGWYTQAGGAGDQIEADTPMDQANDHTLYAYWRDETPPNKPVLPDGTVLPSGWTNEQNAIPLKLYDGVGVTKLMVKVDNEAWKQVSGFIKGSTEYRYDDLSEGEHAYRFRAYDAAGNESGISDEVRVKLDTVCPVIGDLQYENKAADLWQWIIGKKSLVIHVPVTDEGSGAVKITYSMTPADTDEAYDGRNGVVTGTADISKGEAEITFAQDFKGAVAITCTDAAGNISASVTVGTNGVIVEDRAPVTTVMADREAFDGTQTKPGGVTLSEDYYESAPALLVKVTDDPEHAVSAGVKSITYQVGEGSEQTLSVDGRVQETEHVFVIPSSQIPQGVTQISISAEDYAGNVSAREQVRVKVKTPKQPPAADMDYHMGKLTNLLPGEIYLINGREITADEKGCIEIDESWQGMTITIIRKGNGSDIGNSEVQSIYISSTYAVTLEEYKGCVLSALPGSLSPMKEGGSFGFHFALDDGYRMTDDFAVKVNGVKVELNEDGDYIITDIKENFVVTVEGIEKKSTPGNLDRPDHGDSSEDDRMDYGFSNDSDMENGYQSSSLTETSLTDELQRKDKKLKEGEGLTSEGKSESEKDNEPRTGDGSPVELYATLAMIAGLSYLSLYFADRRHGMSEEIKRELVSGLICWAKQGGRIRRLLALAAIFLLLAYYHSIGKKTAVEWKEVYGE